MTDAAKTVKESQKVSEYTEAAAHLAEQCSEWYEGRTGEEMAAYIAAEIRARLTAVEEPAKAAQQRPICGHCGQILTGDIQRCSNDNYCCKEGQPEPEAKEATGDFLYSRNKWYMLCSNLSLDAAVTCVADILAKIDEPTKDQEKLWYDRGFIDGKITVNLKPQPDSSSISTEVAWLESRWKSAFEEGMENYSNALIVALSALKSYAASEPGARVEEPAKPKECDSDLARSLSSGYASCITITHADSAEGERVVSGWSDDKVREFATNWVARAEARQRLADEAIAMIRSNLAAPGDVREGVELPPTSLVEFRTAEGIWVVNKHEARRAIDDLRSRLLAALQQVAEKDKEIAGAKHDAWADGYGQAVADGKVELSRLRGELKEREK